MENIKETITKIIAEYLDEDVANISSETTFSEIGLDSLDIMELVMQIEEEVDCKVDLSPEITNIDELTKHIEAKLEA